jgi:hypothetical protein
MNTLTQAGQEGGLADLNTHLTGEVERLHTQAVKTYQQPYRYSLTFILVLSFSLP